MGCGRIGGFLRLCIVLTGNGRGRGGAGGTVKDDIQHTGRTGPQHHHGKDGGGSAPAHPGPGFPADGHHFFGGFLGLDAVHDPLTKSCRRRHGHVGQLLMDLLEISQKGPAFRTTVQMLVQHLLLLCGQRQIQTGADQLQRLVASYHGKALLSRDST